MCSQSIITFLLFETLDHVWSNLRREPGMVGTPSVTEKLRVINIDLNPSYYK